MNSYKFKLEPNQAQAYQIETALNLCRWLYNTALEQRKFAYEKRRMTLTFYTQKKELTQLKSHFIAFTGVYSQVLQDVLHRLDKAFKAFFRRIKAGERPGYPRFQGKNRYDSFTYSQSGFTLNGK
ncbi:helix-turn-helix domain-containing protein [Hazenella sp. IB182357]|uniref:Helix-turn-helix domain-containing protein n=2 Tax=Polycladospora coralii TaxID=2771432 RepID=A0A926RVF7_9BACL|nr:helix-turn-helix domain-containing protein [Polycladospora coralii]